MQQEEDVIFGRAKKLVDQPFGKKFVAARFVRNDSNLIFRLIGFYIATHFTSFQQWLEQSDLDPLNANQILPSIGNYTQLRAGLLKILQKMKSKYPDRQLKFQNAFAKFTAKKQLLDQLLVLIGRNLAIQRIRAHAHPNLIQMQTLSRFNGQIGVNFKRDIIVAVYPKLHIHQIHEVHKMPYCEFSNCLYYGYNKQEDKYFILYTQKYRQLENLNVVCKLQSESVKHSRVGSVEMLKYCQSCGAVVVGKTLLCKKCLKADLKNTIKNNGLMRFMPEKQFDRRCYNAGLQFHQSLPVIPRQVKTPKVRVKQCETCGMGAVGRFCSQGCKKKKLAEMVDQLKRENRTEYNRKLMADIKILLD